MKLILRSPLEGWLAPLTEVPDPVFADRMLGEGVAIDPTSSELRAPCDGEVIAIAKTQHAITIRADNGAEVLVHVGIDTVALQGEGFDLLVERGQRVQAGQPLLCFDLDRVLRGAKSLITPVLVTNAHAYRFERLTLNRTVSVGETLFEVRPIAVAEEASDESPTGAALRRELIVHHVHGLHARPAALVAAALRHVKADLRVHAHGRAVNARSAVSLMGLGIHARDVITVEASGIDAEKALEIIVPLLGGAQAHPSEIPSHSSRAPVAATAMKGIVASRGIALGRATLLQEEEIALVEVGQGVVHERAELDRARGAVRAHLLGLKKEAPAVAREVIEAHLEFIDDVDLIERAAAEIARGKSAGYAWRASVRESVRILSALDDPRMRERVADLLDIESQVLRALRGDAVGQTRTLPENAVLIAADLKPSQVVALDTSRIAGLCTARGGPTSHVAILAASMGVPALVALGDSVLNIAEGTWLMVDAEVGRLSRLDDEHAKQDAETKLQEKRERARAERIAAQQDCRTADGVRVHVWANLAGLADAQAAVEQGAEGCGLLRTEFLFLDRSKPPDEREQIEQYQGIARVLGDRPLTIRTLDIGGDKPVPYLSLPSEPNPALGLRGVRTSLWRPDLLRTQLRALLRTEPAKNVRILIPMVTDITEVQTVRSVLDEIAAELGLNRLPPLGAMIETPASALLAPELAEVVDFFSIGTNDLTQYVLAMDREHSELAARIDGLHPAVLRMIRLVADAAAAGQREVAVCGGLASDPAAAAILIGLGVRELSCVPSAIPRLKATIRALRVDACESIAARALEAKTAEEVRGLVGRGNDVNVGSSV